MIVAASRYLFVYGTLMSHLEGGMGKRVRARLAAECRSLGPAHVTGLLYDLGRYPGLVAGAAAGAGAVQGELLELRDPPQTLAWLDRYEGIVEGWARSCEYDRRIVTAELASGEPVTAWVYNYRGPVHAARQITSGMWSP